MSNDVAAIAVDGGDLPLGGGLLSLVRPALNALDHGGVLAVISTASSVKDDLSSWCRAEAHEYLGVEEISPGVNRHLITRGRLSTSIRTNHQSQSHPPHGVLSSNNVVDLEPFPAIADPVTGFAPRGASVEQGGPTYPFSLNERDHVAPPEIAKLYDQAVAAQWDANGDVPWTKVKALPAELKRALAQLMTFLAENELSALYVPSRFIARIHPHFAEVAMFLATQLADEARHIDVFLKRARLCGTGLGVSSVITSRSLLSLLQCDDFTEATFLLSVLGEGTFLDLLSFIERFAPD